jgi:hypothetical protein
MYTKLEDSAPNPIREFDVAGFRSVSGILPGPVLYKSGTMDIKFDEMIKKVDEK